MVKIEAKDRGIKVVLAGSTYEMINEMTWAVAAFFHNIFDSFADEGTNARMIEKFGDVSALFDVRPCAFDEFGELVDLTGTGLDSEYDAEILLEQNGQLKWV